MKYNHTAGATKRPQLYKVAGLVVALLITFAIASFIALNRWYQANLLPVDDNSDSQIEVVVESGWNADRIAQELNDKELIRNDTAFTWYVDREGVKQNLQAGTYSFSPSDSVEDIVNSLVSGDVSNKLFTILPGQRLDQIETSIVDGLGFELSEVRSALLGVYDHPIFEDLPEETSIEGYVYPESYQITNSTTVPQLLNASFDQLSAVFTDELREKIADQGLNIHEAVTLASIIEKESSNVEDQPKIAQVFLKRLNEGIVLGSDVTFLYAAVISGQAPSTTIDSPYNTRIVGGLPPGPISNFNASALEAIANPADTDFLYFVAGDDGITYFSKTLAEHESLTAQHCIELCKLPQ